MTRFIFFAALFTLAGCPASTTLVLDGGPGSDAFVPPADSGVDVGTITVADTGTDAGMHPAWDTCAAMADCQLMASGCCETCGMPTLADVDAVNTTQRDAHFMEVCPVPTPCPRCATGSNANLVAVCASSHCAAVDISMLPLSACNADSECIIRYANCCGCSGTDNEVVSVRADAEGAVEQLLCDGGACAADCIPMPPPHYEAACDTTTHHCVARPVFGP